jgi:hypothetical protein
MLKKIDKADEAGRCEEAHNKRNYEIADISRAPSASLPCQQVMKIFLFSTHLKSIAINSKKLALSAYLLSTLTA